MKRSLLVLSFLFSVLMSANADIDSDLIKAVENNQIAEVKRLLDAGANANAKLTEHERDTPVLLIAVQRSLIEIVRVLLDAGADVNAPSDWGAAPIQSASAMGYDDMVKILLNAGADPNFKTLNNRGTALMEAMSNANTSTVGLLIRAGAIVEATLNDSDVRIRTVPTTTSGKTLGALNKGDKVRILGKSAQEERIGNMMDSWLKIETQDGTIGYSYGYFFDYDGYFASFLPTF